MSESFICRRGGGKPFAVIGATYPSGSTCTCTNGSKKLTAKDTSGQALFVIPSTGTWTVTCTNGTDTASEAVSITADGQTKTVNLDYGILFANGDQHTALSGGWVASYRGSADYSIGDTLATGSNNAGTAYKFSTTNKIDLSKYTTLKAQFTGLNLYGSTTWLTYDITAERFIGSGIVSSVVTGEMSEGKYTYGDILNVGRTISRPTEADVVLSYDVSSVSEGYVAVAFGFCTGAVTKVWLE